MPRATRKPETAWTPEEEPAQERFRLVIEERGRELGGVHGWKQQIAAELALRADQLSKILKRRRRVSLATMQDVAARLGFSTEYYFAPIATSFRDFEIRGSPGPAERRAAMISKETARAQERRHPATVGEIADRVIASVTTAEPDLDGAVMLARQLLGHPAIQHAMVLVDPDYLEPRLARPEMFAGRADAEAALSKRREREVLAAGNVALGAKELLGKDRPILDRA